MATLNLRNVPDELVKALKVEAAAAGIGLREYCVEIFSRRKDIPMQLLVGPEKKREEPVGDFYEAGILAGEEFDRREEEAFIARLPDVGGTPRLPRLGKTEKPDLDVLRGICAGNIPQAPQEQFTEPVADLAFLKMCRSCEEPMQAIKGKWVCTVKGCGDEGRAQGNVQ